LMDNNLYNLMDQLIIESRSLWRIKNEYLRNAKEDTSSVWNIVRPRYIPDCPACAAFWVELEKQKEENIRKLESLIRDRMIELDVKSSDISTNPKRYNDSEIIPSD
jgi:hypothetical protein